MLSKLIKGQKGQALPIVLVLLVLGGLVIAPTLRYASTSLKTQSQVYETKTDELYAADSGVEDAIWQIKNEQITTPNQLTVNDKQVVFEIVLEEDVEDFLYELLQKNYSGQHSDWTVVEEEVGADTYAITVTYSGNANVKFITGVGAWLQETYYGYAEGSASGITDDYPNYSFEEKDYKGGTAFIWEWTGGNRPELGTTSGVFTRSLTFQFTPEEVPDFHFSWFVGGSSDVGIITSAETFETWKVTSTATSDDGTSTTIESYVSILGLKARPDLPGSGELELKILTYTIQ